MFALSKALQLGIASLELGEYSLRKMPPAPHIPERAEWRVQDHKSEAQSPFL